MLTEKYKNALNGFKAQARGDTSQFSSDCKAEAQHIYRIIMTESVPISEMDEVKLLSFLEREKSGEADYSKQFDRDGLCYVDLNKDVEVYPCVIRGCIMEPVEKQKYLLSSEDAQSMIVQLQCMGHLSLITETIQSLAQKDDGTLLQTAFPSVDEVKACIDAGLRLPKTFIAKINEWEAMGCSVVNFDFVEKDIESVGTEQDLWSLRANPLHK